MSNTELRALALHAAGLLAATPPLATFASAIGMGQRDAYHAVLTRHAAATAAAETMLRVVAACLTDTTPADTTGGADV